MNAEFVIRQDDVSGELVDKAAEEESGMFEKMVELGSTKAYFVGHAHSYYFQVKVDGIVLGYAPQCGFSKLFETNDNPRYTYVYNVSKDFAFTTTNVVEQEDLGEGLVANYFDGTNGDSIHEATYDSETGLYTMTVKMQKQWARIRFYFNNEVISTADSTYTFAGDYQTGCDTASLKLYPGSNPENLFYPNAAISEYTFTFDPETKTLTVKAPEPKEVDVDGLYCVYTNPDNVVTEATVATADTNGNYVFEVYLKAWRYVQLYYDGVMLSTSNTTIEGLYYNSTSTDWGINLYCYTSVSNALAAGQFSGTYIFIYNPTTKTLTIGMDGLLYNGSEIADYNSSTKTYTFNLQPAVGDKLTLDYDGAALSGSDLTITGAFSTATSGVTGNVYYQKDASTNEFYCAGEGTFIVTYNATTKTLNFEYVEQNGLTYTTRYNGTTDANPVEYEATANSDGTYTINFEFSKAWAYINFTYNGVALTTSNTTFTYTGLAGIYVDGGKSIMCNTTAEALRAYVITYDPVAKTLTMAAA